MYDNRNIAVKWKNALHSVFLHETVILRFRLAVLNFSKILKLFNDSIKIISPPSPSSPETMLVFWRSTYDNGKISRARQLQVSHKRTNIVLWGRGVHVCSNYDNMWRKVVFLSVSS